MTALKNPKAIALLTTALCVASIAWLMSTQYVNRNLESNLEQEKLRSEALLSEKLYLEKDLQKMKDQLTGLKGINQDLDKVVRDTEARFVIQETELKKLRNQNVSLTQIKKQRQELLGIQRDLESELVSLRASYADLENHNLALSSALAQLQEQNRILSNDLNRAMFAAVDHSNVQAVKGKKEKLTVRAKRTQKLIANFEVPASLQNISYRVLDPQGNILSENHGTIAARTHARDQNAIASTAGGVAGDGLQKITMEFTPKKRMTTGIYTVEILNENLYVGSLNVKLR